ncbi:MAG: hypothetical protein D6722_06195, partial [Bacteroidetes bacterium]
MGVWQGHRLWRQVVPVEGASVAWLQAEDGPDSLSRSPRDLSHAPFHPDSFWRPPADTRPWVKWYWWEEIPEDVALISQVQAFHDQGFGGIEIYPLAGLTAGSAVGAYAWRLRQQMHKVLQLAQARGLEVDLHMGVGPYGGMDGVSSTQSLRTLAFGEAQVLGGKWVDMPLPPPRMPGSYLLQAMTDWKSGSQSQVFLPGEAEPLAIYAAPRQGATRAWAPWNLEDYVVLKRDSLLLIGDCPPANGRLRWQAPPGLWHVVVVYELPAGTRLADAYAPDYLDSTCWQGFHSHWLDTDTSLQRGLRAISHDDLRRPVDQPYATGMLPFFEAQMGYDLIPCLPVLMYPGAGHFEMNRQSWARESAFRLDPGDARIRHDFTRMRSDWTQQQYVSPLTSWAACRGLHARSQLYGADLDLIQAAAVAAWPET